MFRKLHAAKWIGAEQLAQILNSIGIDTGTGGTGIDAAAITSGTIADARLPVVLATASLSSSAGVVAIDLAAVTDRYELTLTENVTSWTFTNVPAAGYFCEVAITIVQHASAAKTVVSPATSGRTAGGIAWVADTTVSSRETLVLQCFSDSTRTLFPTGKQV